MAALNGATPAVVAQVQELLTLSLFRPAVLEGLSLLVKHSQVLLLGACCTALPLSVAQAPGDIAEHLVLTALQ